MKAVAYNRVSTDEQNPSRQEIEGIKNFTDKISGSISFAKRPEAKKLLTEIEKGNIEEVHIHSIDRLGRNTLDIMRTIQDLTLKGVNVVSTKEGFQTLIDGKENPISKLMIGILSTLAEFELDRIKDRQREGIEKAKVRGVYKANGGNKLKETREQFLNKKNNKKCYKLIKQGNSLRNAAKLAGVSLGTASKVNKLLIEDKNK
jgi:DNA invertase Pin-like site-specific DNA recombinase